jgi:hypothetical protein
MSISPFLLLAGFTYICLFYGLSWRHPWLALMLIFATSPLQNDLSSGAAAKFSITEINLILALPLVVLRGRRFRMGPVALPVFLYFFVCLMAFVVSPRATTLSSMVQMVLYLVIAVAVFGSLPRRPRDLMPALYALTWVGIFLAFLSLTQTYERLGLNKNGVGASLAVALVVCCELWFGARTRKSKARLSLAFLLITIGLFMTLSRGAWLSAIVGLFVVCAVRRQFLLLGRVVALAIPVLVVGWMLLPQKSKTYMTGFDAAKHENIRLRYESVNIANRNFEKNPLLGVGVGLRKEYDATNVAMLTLAETGILGLGTFALIHLVVIGTAWQMQRRLKRDDPLFPFVALGGALLISRLAHGMVDHYWTRGAITTAWASVGMLTYVYFALRRRRRTERFVRRAFAQRLQSLRHSRIRQPALPLGGQAQGATFNVMAPNAPISAVQTATAPAATAPTATAPSSTRLAADARVLRNGAADFRSSNSIPPSKPRSSSSEDTL